MSDQALPLRTTTRLDEATSRRIPRTGRRDPKKYVYTVIGILILCVMLFPVYWMINISLQPAGPAIEAAWFPLHAQLNGYVQAFQDQAGHLVTSLYVALGSVVLSLLIATPAAYALAQFKVRGVGAVLFGILISQMIPGIVVANALYSAYNKLDLLTRTSTWLKARRRSTEPAISARSARSCCRSASTR